MYKQRSVRIEPFFPPSTRRKRISVSNSEGTAKKQFAGGQSGGFGCVKALKPIENVGGNGAISSLFKFPHMRKQSSLTPSELEFSPGLKSKRRLSRRVQPQKKSLPGAEANFVAKCAYKTKAGSGLNQDSFLIQPFLQGLKSQYLFGVFDGHGSYGQDVSHFLKKHTSKVLEDALFRLQNHDSLSLQSALRSTLRVLSEMLNSSAIESQFSGSTLTAMLIRQDQLICGNVGDSRAVLGCKVQGRWTAEDLTRDHKPELKEEKERILKARGRVKPYTGPDGQFVGPGRVWLDSQELPGLAMSRSLGDKVAHTVGVTSEPDLICRKLGSEDRFLILATSGLWEFVSSEEAVQIVGSGIESGSVEHCCNDLIKEATYRWASEEGAAEDITVIVIFLKNNN